MNLEDDLRVTLLDRAAAPLPPADLLAGVDTGVRQARRRRMSAVAAGAVLVVAASLTAPLIGRGSGRPAPLTGESAAPADAVWGGPWQAAPTFALRPGWLPDGSGPAEIFRMGPNRLAQWDRDGLLLSAEVGPVEPAGEVEAERERSAAVDGRPATVSLSDTYDGAETGDRYVGVRWRLADGDWAQVVSLGSLTESEVLRFAESLGDAEGVLTSGPADFTVAESPPGLVPQFEGTGTLCLATPRQAEQHREPHGMCVNVLDEPHTPQPEEEKLVAGGRDWYRFEDASNVNADLGDGRSLSVSWDPEVVTLSTPDIVRFIAGIAVRR
ncbi:hypothetical protein [Actinoplanes sp. G11-F43]|uniref:hypothetical protein n=1 Tax=Actinoplanes sp. G11-F43 TaxID=3424130 RepID=UPI003D34EEE3